MAKQTQAKLMRSVMEDSSGNLLKRVKKLPPQLRSLEVMKIGNIEIRELVAPGQVISTKRAIKRAMKAQGKV